MKSLGVNVASVAVRRALSNDPTLSKIIQLFDDARKRLVETGTRNRLVHVNRANSRGNVLNIVNERADDVYSILSDHKTMRFLAIGIDKEETADAIQLAVDNEAASIESRYTDARLETRLGPDSLQKKLLKIAHEAKTVEEDSGVNILYLALGFLTWFEDKASSVPREAPLILLPVELVRNARSSTYDVRMRDDEISTNLPLHERLKDDFGLNLPELRVEEGWSPTNYFAEVEEVIAQRPRWKIEPDAIHLGFFSFSKMLMYRDLAVGAWPDGALATHAITRGLLYEGFAGEDPIFDVRAKLDDVLPPEKLFHVVDADASQAKVIEEVRSGRNLVVQGPPGTGKSQAITNIIAAAVKDGKRVLFVAEKMAALSVVHERLVKVGLRDVCLELHSRNANKKAVLNELRRTMAQSATVPGLPAAPTALKEARDKLNILSEALHCPVNDTGDSAYSVLGLQARFIGAGVPPPALNVPALKSMTVAHETKLLEMIERYGALLADGGPGRRHPFEGVRNVTLQPLELTRLAALLVQAQMRVEALTRAVLDPVVKFGANAPIALTSIAPVTRLLESLERFPAESTELARAMLLESDLTRLSKAIAAGADWRAAHDRITETFTDAAFNASIAHLRGPLARGANSFLARWGRAYRSASRELADLLLDKLPRSASERIALIDGLATLRSKKALWESDAPYCEKILGAAWRNEQTDFAYVNKTIKWCQGVSSAPMTADLDGKLALAICPDIIATIRLAIADAELGARTSILNVINSLELDPSVFGEGGIEVAPLTDLASRFGAMAATMDRYRSWASLTQSRDELISAGLAEIVERMGAGELDSASAANELRFARAETIWQTALEQSPVLRSISAAKRHELVDKFAELERRRLAENVTTILAGHLAQMPQGAQGEIGIVRGEIGKKTRQLAIRKLFERAGTALQRIKPVLLMSPISVAQFLPPSALSFDLLIIDEASQVRPEDALGAIARARQIAVVGDQKQLPPSSFFDRLMSDEDDSDGNGGDDGNEDLLGGAAKAGEMESILTLCEARGLGPRMLKWHYRSRDPSLMAVSNQEFYDNALILPPSPLEKDPAYGLCFTRVNGVYDKGGKRDNRGEGEAIIARVAEHAREHPSLSLGIVTFSFAQRNVITELLEVARRADQTLDFFLREGQAEDLFVKNIENVQGDERDVILISIGYGPTVARGRLTSMSFGPVNGEGGERRLNVLFTRARVRCEVFASFDPGDIDISRATGAGPRILKRFLDFAKNGSLNRVSPTGLEADSPLEEDVSDVIRGLGFLVDPQVGSAGFRMDMGVRHPDRPGTYILAVECDGATYHSALWARERDRLRQDVLEHLGWRFHRIWSTDWFYNRQAEIKRLQAALDSAREAAEGGIVIDGANHTRPIAPEPPTNEPITSGLPPISVRHMPPYQRAMFTVQSSLEPHEVAVSTLAGLAKRIVVAEGPIHAEEVARRIAACFGKEKAGSRILTATDSALSVARAGDANLLSDGAFWFTRGQSETPPVRDRSAEIGATLKADNISMLEIEAAVRIARDDNAGGDEQDIIRTAARLLGYRRVGADLQARIARGLR